MNSGVVAVFAGVATVASIPAADPPDRQLSAPKSLVGCHPTVAGLCRSFVLVLYVGDRRCSYQIFASMAVRYNVLRA